MNLNTPALLGPQNGVFGPTSEQAKAKMKESSEQFEAFYIYQFIELMTPEMDPESMFSGGAGEQMYRHNLNEQMAEGITKKGGFGLARQVYDELLKAQERGAPQLATPQAYATQLYDNQPKGQNIGGY